MNKSCPFCPKRRKNTILEVAPIISETKHQLLKKQKRSHVKGLFQQLGEEFFLLTDDHEYFSFDDLDSKEMEIYIRNRWKKGKWIGNGYAEINGDVYQLQEGENIRFKKHLTYCFEQALDELSDPSFLMFTNHLNQLSFSIYDFIYGHNQLLFHHKGASIYVFDNEEAICSVQHFFERSQVYRDRFEFTLSTGERSVVSSFCNYM